MAKLTYKSSGVDITKANTFVDGIQGMVRSTLSQNVLRRPGAFGGLFGFDTTRYREPVLVSSTDGVGTKLLIAKLARRHDTIGIDLVAMNVNDILCCGAQPLFFLDYIACGKVDVKILTAVMKGITEGCRQAGCALVGGETAEMPGVYKKDDYDLAGFTVGVVEKDKLKDGSAIRAGNVVIGLASSGLHSNGYSLARRVFSLSEQKKMAGDLLMPTRIYVKEVLAALEKFTVNGMAHITGGAFYEKLTKILPEGLCFSVNRGSWPVPNIFQKIQKKGRIDAPEMYRAFNMGIGFVLVVNKQDADAVCAFFKSFGVAAYSIGEVAQARVKKIIFSDAS